MSNRRIYNKIVLLLNIIILLGSQNSNIISNLPSDTIDSSNEISPKVITNNFRDFYQNLGNLSNTSSHDPIRIEGNLDFAVQAENESWQGNGSKNNPYVISDFSIVANNQSGIAILNTDIYFAISNVTIAGFYVNTSEELTGAWGIYLSNVSNGNISYNTIINTERGISIENSAILYVAYNYVTGGADNYWISTSNNLVVHANVANANLRGYGFFILYSRNSYFSQNTAVQTENSGFYINNVYWSSSSPKNITLIDNQAINTGNDGFSILNSAEIKLYDNFAQNNSGAGFRLWTSSFIPEVGTRNNILVNNSAFRNKNGFSLYSSSNNTLINNTALENNQFGFHLLFAYNNQLLQNTAILNSLHGFLIAKSSGNTMQQNIASLNLLNGFLLHQSHYNTLMHNIASHQRFVDGIPESSSSSNGFRLYLSNNNVLIENSAINNTQAGFLLYQADHNDLVSNNVVQNLQEGIFALMSVNNNFSLNTIMGNKGHGIRLEGDNWTISRNNDILFNVIVNQTNYGVFLGNKTQNTRIFGNQLINNNHKNIQALDHGINNNFTANYWSDWNTPDTNADGIVTHSTLLMEIP